MSHALASEVQMALLYDMIDRAGIRTCEMLSEGTCPAMVFQGGSAGDGELGLFPRQRSSCTDSSCKQKTSEFSGG